MTTDAATSQDAIIASLPPHLRPFVQRQDHAAHYTARDHAVWRFLLRRLTRQLADTAHPVYLEGLERTGIALDHIPSIDEMNACLASLGWRAVVVDGFIPPAIFMEFQALKVLVIALDMRSVEHTLYTPAPDIVHESAGHAPFLVDVDYAEFLQRFGEVGMRAIATKHDFELYEAIRRLSILKESPQSTEAEIAAAAEELERLSSVDEAPSEAALLARLHWWTVEYGLVGELDDYRIFGAGLLSSLGESRHCLDDDRVRKLPLTVDAVTYPYDITAEQPQLFVTSSCKHLSQVLEEFAASMAFRRGGAESLRKAIDAGAVCTAELDSGVQVSGEFVDVLEDAVGNAIFYRTAGPTQLAFRDRELYGHGTETHGDGFASPVGMLKDFSRCLSDYTVDELRAHDIALDRVVTLAYLSGITVRGTLRAIVRQEHRNLLFRFEDCTVTALDGRVLAGPGQASLDLAVGAAVTSVYGGTADRDRFRLYKPLPATPTGRPEPDQALMESYRRIDALPPGAVDATALTAIEAALDRYPGEWLLRVELLRRSEDCALPAPLLRRAREDLGELGEDPALSEVLAVARAA